MVFVFLFLTYFPNMIISSYIHGAENGFISFFMAEYSKYICTIPSLSIHLSMDI